MPYASDAQRGWMHVNRPDIAAKWDAEIHKKKGALKRKAKMKRRQ